VLDEITSSNSRTVNNAIKFLITEDTTITMRKFGEGERKLNYSNLFFLSNADLVLDMELTERRYVLFEPNNKYVGTNDPKIIKLLTDIGNRDPSIFRAYMERRVITTDGHSDKPVTGSLIKHKVRSMNDPLDLWLLELLTEPPRISDPHFQWFAKDNRIPNNEVFEVFIRWANQKGFKNISKYGLFNQLSERYGISQRKPRDKNDRSKSKRSCEFPSFVTLRLNFAKRLKIKNTKMIWDDDYDPEDTEE
jgi:hypothetical protein